MAGRRTCAGAKPAALTLGSWNERMVDQHKTFVKTNFAELPIKYEHGNRATTLFSYSLDGYG